MEVGQLYQIKAHLDMILLALEALTGMGSETMLQAAKELQLQHILSDRLVLWRLRQTNPYRKSGKGTSGRKKLDVDEAKAIALITAHIARRYQTLIRSAVTELEQSTAKKQAPNRQKILGDYLDRFFSMYDERMGEPVSGQNLEDLALKLLVDLFFYSADRGVRRLWMSLLEKSWPEVNF